jgi:hypothetical protein
MASLLKLSKLPSEACWKCVRCMDFLDELRALWVESRERLEYRNHLSSFVIQPHHINPSVSLSLSPNPLHNQMPPISTNHTPRNIRVPHTIQITLSHILRLPNLPRSHLSLETLHHSLPLILRHPMPKLRLNSPGANQIDPQRLQIDRQLPRQTVQTRRKRTNNRPIRDRVLGDRASGDGITTPRTRTKVSRQEFPQKHRSEEAHHAGLLDERHICLCKLNSCEGVTGREHGVVERVGSVGGGFVEESGEVAFEGCFVVQVAGVAGYAGFG